MKKILIQKALLLAASGVAGYMLYLLFGEKIGNGIVRQGNENPDLHGNDDQLNTLNILSNDSGKIETGSLPI